MQTRSSTLQPSDALLGTQVHGGAKIAWRSRYLNTVLAREVSASIRYYDRVIQLLPLVHDSGLLLTLIDVPAKTVSSAVESFPDLRHQSAERTAVLLNGTLNYHLDIQSLLVDLRKKLSRTARLVLVLYNPYIRWLYQFANWLHLRNAEVPATFLTRTDLDNLACLSGFEVVRERPALHFPWRLFGLGALINRFLAVCPLVRRLSLGTLAILRPVMTSEPSGITCVIPARNERGNIRAALDRFPDLGCATEIIFVEGGSSDGTWDEIQRLVPLYQHRFRIKALRQTGKGKADAVRLGFSHASEELVCILDADLTMPPEMLGRFLDAYREGKGDFINGSRLVYPMEGEAMRFLNRLGNVFFAKALSWVMDARVGDALCGTKLLSRADYRRIEMWRTAFGDFDPFGDFELLFATASMALGIVDVPVRYRCRTYGSTNIRRFRDGLQLMKMTFIGFSRMKIGVGAKPSVL